MIIVSDAREDAAFTLTEAPGSPIDMPLDQAVYVPSVGGRDPFIAAVRGSHVLKLDPDTGELIASVRFFATALPPSVITYLGGATDSLYASYTVEVTPLQPVSSGVLKRFLIPIDPDDLSLGTPIDISKATGIFGVQFDGPRQGAVDLLGGADGIVYIGSQYMANSLSNGVLIGRFDHSNPTQQTTGGVDAICSFTQIARDDTTGKLWCTDESGPAVASFVPSAVSSWSGGFSTGQLAYFAKVVGFGNQSVHIPAGICYDQPRETMWVTARETNAGAFDATKHCFLIPVPTNIVPDSNANIEDPSHLAGIIDLGTASQAYRARYWGVNNRIYIPIPGDDSVKVVNPASGTLEATKTGFDAPWDMVFTPSKAWAVQQGLVGLKLLT